MKKIKTEKSIGTIWISGVTASGKTTLGKVLYRNLLDSGIDQLIHLDGDELRAKQQKVYGHSLEERMELIQKYIELIKEENNYGNLVIISTVSHRKEMRDSARSQLSNFMEVNLLCETKICSDRDYKNIYNRIDENSNECLPGVTEPYMISENADLILDTGNNSLIDCHNILFQSVLDFLERKDSQDLISNN